MPSKSLDSKIQYEYKYIRDIKIKYLTEIKGVTSMDKIRNITNRDELGIKSILEQIKAK